MESGEDGVRGRIVSGWRMGLGVGCVRGEDGLREEDGVRGEDGVKGEEWY